MKHLTDTLNQHTYKTYTDNPTPPNLNKNIQHKSSLFMQRFQTINQNHHQNSSNYHLEPNQDKYAQVISQSNQVESFIDGVCRFNGDAIEIHALREEYYVDASILPNFKEHLKKELQEMKWFFKGRNYENYREIENKEFITVQTYSQILSSFGRNLKATQKSRPKPPQQKQEQKQLPPKIKQAKELKEIQVDTQQLQQKEYQKQLKVKKIDIILMQLVGQKKRKALVHDYFMTMEIKLMELLDYILEDQMEYFNLDASMKTRLVLKNLESFKGKSIDGESKINLLKIFFQEFTMLKKQKQEIQLRTPIKKIENKQKLFSTSANVKKTWKNKTKQTPKQRKQQKKDVMTDDKMKLDKKGNKFMQQRQWIQNLP